MTTAFAALAAIIVACGVYRLHYMDAHTVRLSVRLAFWALTVAYVYGIVAVLTGLQTVDWYDLVQAAAVAAVQGRTAMLWRHGVPTQYRR